MADELTASSEVDIWSSDVLGRKRYADFLTDYIVRKTKVNSDFKPFILALDADWGAGKTYFITRWQEDLSLNSAHPTFIFDAWKSDYQTDPLLAFISAFKQVVDGYIDDLVPSNKKISKEIRAKLKVGLKQVQSAIIPMAKHLAIGLANKATAGAIDSMLTDKSFDLANFEKEALGELGDTLEKCFEKALEEQANKEKLFKDFRTNITEALKLLEAAGNINLPFIIFIDEIDRCRPNFAVELLECLKHLFDIPGLCFVVSTNLEQLSHSVSGVYGTNFDGRNYLQRFFDVEFTLPAPNNRAYAEILVDQLLPSELSNLYLGLPRRGFVGQQEENSPHIVVEWVSEYFNLDLRSQKKMIELIDAAISSISDKPAIHLMWLTLLAALRIKAPEAFDLIRKGDIPRDRFFSLLDEVAGSEKLRDFSSVSRGQLFEKQTSLKTVFFTYYQNSQSELIELRQSRQDLDLSDTEYPDSIIQKITEEAPSSWRNNQKFYSSVKDYYELISCAGHLINQP